MIFNSKIIQFLSLFFLILLSSCTTNKKLTKQNKPTWLNYNVKIENNYLIAMGISSDFGSKSWQMAEISAHKKMAKVLDIYIDVYKQSYKKFIKDSENNKSGAIRIIAKKHIISKAILGDLEIVKDKNKRELRWHDEKTNQYYILIRLNLKKADKKISKQIAKELPPKTQEKAIKELTNRAKDAHRRLSDKLKNMKWE